MFLETILEQLHAILATVAYAEMFYYLYVSFMCIAHKNTTFWKILWHYLEMIEVVHGSFKATVPQEQNRPSDFIESKSASQIA